MSQPASPCTGICQIDKASGWCLGCLRSLKEIARWSHASKSQKQQILAELGKRRLP